MLFRISILLGLPFCLILLTIIVLVALSGRDQIRPLPVSENIYEPILKGEELQRVKELARQPNNNQAKTSLLEITKNSLPWPNTAEWPTELKEEAGRFHLEMCELLADYLTLVERTRGLSREEAYAQLEKLEMRKSSIAGKHKNALRHSSKAEYAELFDWFRMTSHATLTGLYVDRGQWINAALCNLKDWDQATYYLRRGGIKGRCVLAIWSFQRRLGYEMFK